MISESAMESKLVESLLERLGTDFSGKAVAISSNEASAGRQTQTTIEEERETIRKEIMKAISVSNQAQRLYFVIRSMIMSTLGAIVTFFIVWHLGTIDVMEDFISGVSTYAGCLALSRMFDDKIVNISRRISLFLGEHSKLRNLILKSF